MLYVNIPWLLQNKYPNKMHLRGEMVYFSPQFWGIVHHCLEVTKSRIWNSKTRPNYWADRNESVCAYLGSAPLYIL